MQHCPHRFQLARIISAGLLNSITKLKKTWAYTDALVQVEAAVCTTTQIQRSPTLEEVRVDMAEMKVDNKQIELVTSVGSCVAICLHDSVNKCGGLAHIMLPDSAISPRELLPSKFADTAVLALAKALRKTSKKEGHLSAKIAGGANMFQSLKNTDLNVGTKNIEAVKVALIANKIKLHAENVARTQHTVVENATELAEVAEQMTIELGELIEKRTQLLNEFLEKDNKSEPEHLSP